MLSAIKMPGTNVSDKKLGPKLLQSIQCIGAGIKRSDIFGVGTQNSIISISFADKFFDFF